jgi:hypothetical protein
MVEVTKTNRVYKTDGVVRTVVRAKTRSWGRTLIVENVQVTDIADGSVTMAYTRKQITGQKVQWHLKDVLAWVKLGYHLSKSMSED